MNNPGFQLSHLILFSAIFHVFMAVARILQRPRSKRSIYLAGAFTIIAWSLLHAYCTISGDIRVIPHILYTHVPAFYLLGPLSFRWLKGLVGHEAGTKGLAWESLPAVAVTIFLIPVYILPSAEKLKIAEGFITTGNVPLQGRIVFLSGLTLYGLYLVPSIVLLRPYFTMHNLRREPAVIVAGAVIVYAIVLTVGTGYSLFGHRWCFVGVMSGLSLFAPALFLLGARYPDFFFDFQKIVERGKYEVSRLSGKNIESIRSLLSQIMREEQLYQEERLTLEDLAARVSLSPHALSEFLNLHAGTNFAGFVNGWRIERACEIILADPSRTVLSVAFEVGFTAKSTFNSAFLRHKSQPPSEFRRRAKKG